MIQKLTREIVSPEMAVSPIKTKREKLLHVWIARNKKAARTRSLMNKVRKAAKAGKMEHAA
jgi:hypothetical protein